MTTATKNIGKLLDELMGVNRNGDRQEYIIEHFTDDRVCKYDLLGLCPYKLFPNTKYDLGPCPFPCCPVPPKFKKQYEEERKFKDFGYERDLEIELARIQDTCDEKIAKAQTRLDVVQKKEITNNESIEVLNIKKEIEKVTKQIEELTTEGEYEEAQKLMERLDSLKKEKEIAESKAPTTKLGNTQELIICEVCGALLSVNESDQRLADHFAGKAHLGFQKVREKLKELRDLRVFHDKRQQTTDRERYKQMKEVTNYDFYDTKRKRLQQENENDNNQQLIDSNVPSLPIASSNSNINSSRDSRHYHESSGRGSSSNDYRSRSSSSDHHYHSRSSGGGRDNDHYHHDYRHSSSGNRRRY
ncbi:hypothetical protein ABK040_013848 [Willaertia magna]